MARNHARCINSFCYSPRVSYFGSSKFSRRFKGKNDSPFSRRSSLVHSKQDKNLISKDATVQVDDSLDLCLSPVFIIPKRSGGLRMILNLKYFNTFLPSQHFRMETLSTILPQISNQDWAVSIDLQDAYLHVPIHQNSQRFLGFTFLDRTFKYRALPFGLRDSPWVFTRLVSTLIAFLRRRGLRIFQYLELAPGSQLASSSSGASSGNPPDHSGVRFSHQLEAVVSYPPENSFLSGCGSRFSSSSCSPHGTQNLGSSIDCSRPDLQAHFIGPSLAEIPGPSGKFCRLDSQLSSFDAPSSTSLPEVFLPLRRFSVEIDPDDSTDPHSLPSVVQQRTPPPGKTFFFPSAGCFSFHRRFSSGLGCFPSPSARIGSWSEEEALGHINFLELTAIYRALQHFVLQITGLHVRILSDNATAASYINLQGGTHSHSLSSLAQEIWNWCLRRNISFPPTISQVRTIWWQIFYPEACFFLRSG